MVTTGVAVFDSTIQSSNRWFEELMDELHWKDKYQTYLALRIGLHTLRDMMATDGVATLGNSLPMLIRGLYYEGWVPAEKPARKKSRPEMLGAIRDYFNGSPEIDPNAVAHAVFRLIIKSMAESGVKDPAAVLPQELAELWSAEKEETYHET